ncbi:MAG: glycoside hydrolase family 43 protein [Anaerolineales bacterium]
MSHTYKNPIIPGFYPDPSICRVGKDYYLVTSTFEYFPGLPIFHSRDLVNWRQIGHVLDRPSQLPLDGIRASGGLYAPTIRFHKGLFYVINTLVDGLYQKGNFIVTAKDPNGPWSDPYWLEDAPGIDPSLLFDDDGRAWYCGNRIPPTGEQYIGHREIWLQELDLNGMKLTGPKYSLWDGALKGNLHAEAPHIYKINGTYYLMIAEAGTGHNHAVTIARSDQITGPYKINHRNPILTHRHLGLEYPIVGTGHADIVETQNGEWWMVCLAMRPYGGYFYNLGRETFLVPVIWEEGWPVIAPGAGKVKFHGPAPSLPEKLWPMEPACDNFDGDALAYPWNFIRTPRQEFWSLHERPGFLRLQLRPETIMERANPSFVGRRQQHINFAASLAMEFTPGNSAECAGLVLLQNENYQIRCVVTLNNSNESILQLTRREAGIDQMLHEQNCQPGRIYLKVEAKGQDYQFSAANQFGEWLTLGDPVDGRVLSTPVAGGFTGTYIGMYASSNGNTSENLAYFDWFEYLGR